MKGIAISEETRKMLLDNIFHPNYSFIWHFNWPTKVKWPRGYVEDGIKELMRSGMLDAAKEEG